MKITRYTVYGICSYVLYLTIVPPGHLPMEDSLLIEGHLHQSGTSG